MSPVSFSPSAGAGRFLFPFLALLLILFWSSGFVGIRFASEQAPVFLVLFWRTLISGLLLLPFALWIGPRLSRRVLVEQAGGVVCAYDGGPLDLASGRVIACAPGLRQPLIDGLAACRPLSGASFGAPELDGTALEPTP